MMKDVKIEVRIAAVHKRLIACAAARAAMSMSDFVRLAALDKARRIVGPRGTAS